MNKTNNQIRREEFEKRRAYKGTLSQCQAGYDCSIFMNCLLEINQLKKQLEEKNKAINETIDYIKNITFSCEDEDIHLNELFDTSNLLEILERGKNVNSK